MYMDNHSYILSFRLRFLVGAIYALSLIDYFFIALQYAEDSYWQLFLARLIHVSLLLAPFCFYRQKFPWFHPLIFNTLIGAIRLAFLYFLQFLSGEDWSLVIFENDALPYQSENQIAGLMCQEQLLLGLSLLVYYAAYFLFPPLFPRLRQIHFFAVPRHFARKAIVLLICSSLAFLVFIYLSGGIVEHIGSWQGGRKSALSGIGYLAMLIYSSAIACLIWRCIEKKAEKTISFWLVLIVSLTLMLLLGGSRSYLINVAVIVFLLWIYDREQISKTALFLMLSLVFLFVGFWGSARTQIQKNAQFDWEKVRSVQFLMVEAQRELVMRASVRKAVYPILSEVPKETPYLYGKSYLAAALCWVPRQFWADKPGLIDGLVGETFFDVNVGIPPGPIGEAYWNFGYLGIMLVFLVYGLFHRGLFTLFQNSDRSTLAFLLYSLLLFNVYPITSSVISALLLFVPAVILCWSFRLVRRA